MSQNNQFKKSKAYKIIVAGIVLLYAGYQFFTGGFGDATQDVDSNYVNETQYTDSNYRDETLHTDSDDVNEEQHDNLDDTDTNQTTEAVEALGTNLEFAFRNDGLLESHYEKHGIEMGFLSEEEYLQAANAVLNNPNTLHKIEAEDGDDVYFLEETNEFVVVSKDGYIRTYFYPEDGIEYFNRQ